jgi:cytochrome c553
MLLSLIICASEPVWANSDTGTASVRTDEVIFKAMCSFCHPAPDTNKHTKDEWPAVVDRMNRHRAESGISTLTDTEKAAILRHLQGNAK